MTGLFLGNPVVDVPLSDTMVVVAHFHMVMGMAQMVFLFNMIWSLLKGKPAGSNPWRATTLEWQTPETPPGHGNWGKELPVVYRWAYDYSVPGAKEDFVPQNQPPVPRAA